MNVERIATVGEADVRRLILVDPNEELTEAWRRYFDELTNVEIVEGYFEDLPEFDCMVSAANSFGLMDGGVDLSIINFFGYDLMRRVQDHILAEFGGEQPVGTSFLIATGNAKHRFVAHTPTMRVPMPISRTDNVYLAMSAMLFAVQHHNRIDGTMKIQTIACPGLGTATGKMPVGEAAHQMAVAYANFLRPPTQISWQFAYERQGQIRYGGDDGFRMPPHP